MKDSREAKGRRDVEGVAESKTGTTMAIAKKAIAQNAGAKKQGQKAVAKKAVAKKGVAKSAAVEHELLTHPQASETIQPAGITSCRTNRPCRCPAITPAEAGTPARCEAQAHHDDALGCPDQARGHGTLRRITPTRSRTVPPETAVPTGNTARPEGHRNAGATADVRPSRQKTLRWRHRPGQPEATTAGRAGGTGAAGCCQGAVRSDRNATAKSRLRLPWG